MAIQSEKIHTGRYESKFLDWWSVVDEWGMQND